ncbi:histone deacetylase family protein [Acuticoccus sp. MNP-M23]|uniref:histone deacetylase family protein n=1 Tax=Acuticoccus sp. MNP-M23 TaxID=3072793 RepID=UPI0028150011|nr:histone deacetylase family protein [Acuticoccus sp. MNP-M23]WMS43286.1 histone deacetylase family protein [Acuticoccus sp. MNP-M23]
MRVFYAPETEAHAPSFFLLRGKVAANEERAERATRLIAALDRIGLSHETPPDAGVAPLAAVHTPRYLAFLAEAARDWQAMAGTGPEVVGNAQPRRPEASYPDGLVGRAGWHMADLACPVGPHTGHAARRAADCAVAAAAALSAGARETYALTRPPGHHAGAEVAGGHCFLNNAAIAAAALARDGARPAILDIDVHHGNGTQAIFYGRADVLTVSIHADPHHFYPWFVGHGAETGAGAGEGYNRNRPLPLKSTDDAWLAALAAGLDDVARFGADTLVLALGLDVHESDPLGGMAVTTEGLRRAGELIGQQPLPVLITQEGGYLAPSLTDNAAAFLGAFMEAR